MSSSPNPEQEVREALKEAIDLADEGWSYASDYFREKWAFEERIAELRAALQPTKRSE